MLITKLKLNHCPAEVWGLLTPAAARAVTEVLQEFTAPAAGCMPSFL